MARCGAGGGGSGDRSGDGDLGGARLGGSVQELSTYLLCRSVEELKARSGWDGGGGASRRLLLDELQEHIPPSLLLPENRLETLLQQAVRWQTLHAPPLTPDDVSPSLFEDVSFRHDGLPREASLVLEGHADEVWCVAFSHSGAALASASRDGAAACKCWPPRGASLTCSRLVRTGAIVLWEATQPQFARRALIPAHSGAIASVAWSPDDTLLLSCAADRTVKLWNAPAGDCAATFREHTEAVTAVVWLPSGAHFLSSSSAGKRVILWDLGGNALQSWHGPRVTDLAVAADGARLLAVSGCTVRSCPLTAGSDGTPRMVTEDVHSWDETDAISSLALSRDSRAVHPLPYPTVPEATLPSPTVPEATLPYPTAPEPTRRCSSTWGRRRCMLGTSTGGGGWARTPATGRAAS